MNWNILKALDYGTHDADGTLENIPVRTPHTCLHMQFTLSSCKLPTDQVWLSYVIPDY